MLKKDLLNLKAGSAFSSNYTLGFYDNSVFDVFSLTPDVIPHLENIRGRTHGVPQRMASELYSFLHENISYGTSKRNVGYLTAKEVWENKEGVCGEMSFLYIACARYLGMQSAYVSVRRDYKNKKVRHACASVNLPHPVYVDIAYHTYNIHHCQFQTLNDFDIITNVSNWRK